MTMADLDYSVREHVATIQLNRPHRKNSFTYEMIDRWAEVLHEAQSDNEVRCVVLTGSEDSFCSGVDLDVRKEVPNIPFPRLEALTRRIHKVARAVMALDKPMLAAVNGPAIGAGMDMAL